MNFGAEKSSMNLQRILSLEIRGSTELVGGG